MSDQPSTKSMPESPAQTIALSPSVQHVERELSIEARVTAWRVVQSVLQLHGEYGQGQAERFRTLEPTPPHADARHVDEWIDAARSLLRTPTPNELTSTRRLTLSGRLLILCLARVDANLRTFLEQDHFLATIERELQEPFESLLRRDAPGFGSDPAPLHLDDPAASDRLGRRAFARGLAFRLKRIWADNIQSHRSSSFILHLHGPWGAGKTSLLNLLRTELQPELQQPPLPATGEGWVIVDFNAWKNQRLDPPWWPLLESVYKQSRAQLLAYGDRRRARRLRMREWLWRIVVGKRELLITLMLFAPVAALVYWFLSNADGLKVAGDSADSVQKIIALLGAVLTAVLPIARALFAGSARAAQSFVDSANDPLTRVSRHFDEIVHAVERPIMITIDDLDRCQRPYVVTLLEGMQTLFSNSRVIYVVAADRRWLDTSFEKAYSEFSTAVVEPGRKLGSLFLEKCFQLSVSVPRVSDELKRRYWQYLINGAPADVQHSLAETEDRVRAEMARANGLEEMLRQVAIADDGDPVAQQVRREIAVELLADAAAEKGTEAFLEPFAPLIDANPRSMKRFVNAYAVHRDLAILAGVDLGDVVRRKQLALWTIVALQWPMLQDYFVALLDGEAVTASPELRILYDSDDVQRVLKGEAAGVNVALDMAAVTAFSELRTANRGISTVA